MLLALNAGSSSLKVALFEHDATEVLRGEIAGGRLIAGDIDEPVGDEPVADLLRIMDQRGALTAVGHRIVHGGAHLTKPALITDALLAEIEALTPLARLHQPKAVAPIHAVLKARPGLPQVACFDTAFHADMPDEAKAVALPPELGVRRFGFHGLSYEYIAGKLAETAPELAAGRVIVAHLGSGASLCAMRAGRSVETTMSMTALDGLVMATRPGVLDPGIVLYLQQSRGMSVDQIEDLLYRHAGMSGVSGIGGDTRQLLASSEPRAAAAIDLFVYRVTQQIGALVAVLGGLDCLVFTGGIGEHAAPIRARIVAGLDWLAKLTVIDTRVIPTDEEVMIARHTRDLVAQGNYNA